MLEIGNLGVLLVGPPEYDYIRIRKQVGEGKRVEIDLSEEEARHVRAAINIWLRESD